jgi:hypothetical protein
VRHAGTLHADRRVRRTVGPSVDSRRLRSRPVQEMVWTRVDDVDRSRHVSVGWIRSYPAADGWTRQVFAGAVAGAVADDGDGWRLSHTIISVPPRIPNGAMK